MSDAPGGGQDRAPRRNADLGIRLASTAVLLPLALVCSLLGSWPFFGLVAVGSAVIFAEWAHVVDRSEHLVPRRPEIILGSIIAAAAAIAAGWAGPLAGCLVALAGVLAAALLTRSPWLVGGAVYAGALAIPIPAIRADPAHGFEALMTILVVVWATDSFAFFAGRTIGGPKLWPRISPKKTWSGSIGGLVGGVACGLAWCHFVKAPLTLPLFFLLVALSLASEAGDLLESAVKRRFAKKDSSGIIPGHGGLMDRVDGLVFAGALALLVGWMHGGGSAIAAGVLFW